METAFSAFVDQKSVYECFLPGVKPSEDFATGIKFSSVFNILFVNSTFFYC